MTKSSISGRTVLLGGVALAGMLGVTLLSVGDGGLSGVAVAEARGGGGGNGPGGGSGQGHGWSDGPGGHDFGGGPGNRGGGWGDGGGRRGGDGGSTPDAPAHTTSTGPSGVTDSASTTDDTPAAGLHGDGSGALRLIELFGAAATSPPPGIGTTPAGPDLTHQEERALIARGWRGTP